MGEKVLPGHLSDSVRFVQKRHKLRRHGITPEPQVAMIIRCRALPLNIKTVACFGRLPWNLQACWNLFLVMKIYKITVWPMVQQSIAKVCISVLDRTLVLRARLVGYHSDECLPTSSGSKYFNYVDCLRLRRPLVPGCLLLLGTRPPLWAGHSFSVAVAMEYSRN